MALKIYCASFSEVVNDGHASHMASGQLPKFIRNDQLPPGCAWTMNYHVWAAILEAYHHKLHPKPKSVTEFKELQVIWDNLPHAWTVFQRAKIAK